MKSWLERKHGSVLGLCHGKIKIGLWSVCNSEKNASVWESDKPGLQSQAWSWASCFNSLILSFLDVKWVMIALIHKVWRGLNSIYVKLSARCMAQSRHLIISFNRISQTCQIPGSFCLQKITSCWDNSQHLLFFFSHWVNGYTSGI